MVRPRPVVKTETPKGGGVNSIFSQIKPTKVSEEIVQQIKSLIKEGKLEPGEKLPSERSLAEMLGVGRSSLREAINILETLGFLEIKKRKGTFVRSVSSPILSDPLMQILEEDKSKLYDLYELRKDIELGSAYMAAKVRTEKDLADLEKWVKRMGEDAKLLRVSLRDDLGFHMAVARATHNFLRVHILKRIFDLSGEYVDFIRQQGINDPYTIPRIFDHHEKILEAIRQQDQEGARGLMDEHLTWVEDEWINFGKTEIRTEK